jgi:uncharacterized protein with ParB-like and HNH nuclease domain
MRYIFEWDGYDLDFDVFLPSIGKNLQRPFCWTLAQNQALILSVLKGIPLPPMAFIHQDHEIFQVIDGKQRLNALITFIKGEFPISFGGKPYFYADLDDAAKHAIYNLQIVGDTAYEYLKDKEYIVKIPDAVKIAWFERINYAGTQPDIGHLKDLKGEL